MITLAASTAVATQGSSGGLGVGGARVNRLIKEGVERCRLSGPKVLGLGVKV